MMRAALLAFVLATTPALAQAPPIASAKPLPGFAVAFLTTGIDYAQPDIASRIARDGEGEAVAWSAVTQSARPFLRGGPDDSLVRLAPYLVAPIQVDPARSETWPRTLAFLIKSPLRVAVLTTPIPTFDATAAPAVLFFRPASETDATQRADNVVAVAALPHEAGIPTAGTAIADIILAPPAAAREAPSGPDQLPRTAVEAAVLAAALFMCMDLSTARSPAHAKRLLIAKAQTGIDDAAPILPACR